eukprot:8113117-Pyramimonas_sp.AAC.1
MAPSRLYNLRGAIYVLQHSWCKLCCVVYVEQSMWWCKLPGATHFDCLQAVLSTARANIPPSHPQLGRKTS